MNTAEVRPSSPRRSVWRWVALGAALLLTPFVVVAFGVWSVLSLDGNAAGLRREVMRGTGSAWNTRVQLNANWAVMQVVKGAAYFVPAHQHGAEARLALDAVQRASVGVYERAAAQAGESMAATMQRTDELMEKRGMVRVIGVIDQRSTVLGYVSAEPHWGNRVDFCLAVVDGKELVVVSTRVDGDALATLVEQCADTHDLRSKLKLAKLKI